MPVRSPYPDVEIPEVSLFDFLFTDFGDRAEVPAFIDGSTGAEVTFGELKGMVLRLAGELSVQSYPTAVAAAEAADLVRGYEDVKLAGVRRYRARLESLGLSPA